MLVIYFWLFYLEMYLYIEARNYFIIHISDKWCVRDKSELSCTKSGWVGC